MTFFLQSSVNTFLLGKPTVRLFESILAIYWFPISEGYLGKLICKVELWNPQLNSSLHTINEKCQNLRRGDVVTAAQLRLTDDSSQSKSGAGGGRAPIYYDYAREGLRNQRDRRRRQGLGGGLGGLVEGPEETRGSQGVTCTSKPLPHCLRPFLGNLNIIPSNSLADRTNQLSKTTPL